MLNSASDKSEGLIFCSGYEFGDGVPDEIDAIAEGAYTNKIMLDGTSRPLVITKEDVIACVDHLNDRTQRHPNRDIVIDYEHQTLFGDIAPAAGWFNQLKLITRDGKAVARAPIKMWTPKAAQMIAAKEYRYQSPVFQQYGTDKETGKLERCMLINIALTNEPFLDNLMPIASKNFSTQQTGKDKFMDELIERLRYFLNLPTAATAQDCLTELNKLMTQLKEALAAQTEVAAKDVFAFLTGIKTEIAAKADLIKEICAKDNGTFEEAKATYLTAKGAQTELVAAKAELATLKEEKFTREFDAIIAKAFTDGKILPTQKSDTAWMESQKQFALKDMAAFNAFWDKQPKIAPTGKLPETGTIAAKDITEEDKAMAAKLGVPVDQLEKHNKK